MHRPGSLLGATHTVVVAAHFKIQGGRHSKNTVLPVTAMESVKRVGEVHLLLASQRVKWPLLTIDRRTQSVSAITGH